MRRSVFLLALIASACAEPEPSLLPVLVFDGGPSAIDAGQADGGAADAATTVDAGAPPDAGPTPDAGAGPDAGTRADAGSTIDAGTPSDAGSSQPDAGGPTDAGPVDGIVFAHGINGSSADWAVMVGRFQDAGWPADRLVATSFSDPRWGCNTSNAMQVATWVQTLKSRGARRIAIVAHSMGGLSTRYYVKNLSGTNDVAVYVSLGTMHHGLSSPCLNPLPVCVWQELCQSGSFISALNATPATPGPTVWHSIFSDGDTTVPMASSQLTGATNRLVPGLEHAGPMGLQDSDIVFQHVREALR